MLPVKFMLTLIALQCHVMITISEGTQEDTPPRFDCESVVYAYLNQPKFEISCKAIANPLIETFNIIWHNPSNDINKQELYGDFLAEVENGETEYETVLVVQIDRVMMQHFRVYTFMAANSFGESHFNVTLEEKSDPPREEMLWCIVHKSVEANAWNYDQEMELQRRLDEAFQADPPQCATPCDGQCYNVGQCSTLQATISSTNTTQYGTEQAKGIVSDQRCMTEGELSSIRRSLDRLDGTVPGSCMPVTIQVLTILYGNDVNSLFSEGSKVNGSLCFCDEDLCNASDDADVDEVYTSVDVGHVPGASHIVLAIALAAMSCVS